MSDGPLHLARISNEDPLQPVPKAPENEVGVGFNLPFSIPFRDATSLEVLRDEGSEGPTPRQLVAMRRTDGQARALYRLVTLPIRAALKNMQIVMDESDKGGEAERVFIDQMFTLPPNAGGMTVTLQTVVAQMLMAVFDGFSAFEQVYWIPTRGPLKGKWTLKKLAHRPTETITFLTDDSGGFAGLRQQANFAGRVVDEKIDADNAVYYAANEEERKFYGVSYFQSAFYHFDKKVKIYYIAHLAAQRAAVGTRKGTMPANAGANDKVKFERSLADLGVAQWINLPNGYDVESLKEGGTFDFLAYVNHHNSQMSKSVLASFFDDNQGGGKSDTSLVNFGQQSDAMFILMLQTIMDEIATIINHYVIPKFIDWNFGSSKYPKFRWGTFTDEQKKAVQSAFEKLSVAGQTATVTPQFLFELEKLMAEELNLDLDYTELEKQKTEDWARERKDKQMMSDAQAQAMQQPQQAGFTAESFGEGGMSALLEWLASEEGQMASLTAPGPAPEETGS